MTPISGGTATHDYAGIVANAPVKTIKLAEDVTSFEKAKTAFDRIEWAIHKGKLGLSRSRNGDLQIASNVYLRWAESYMAVVLYDTEIVRYYPDGTFSVDNGGYNTPTTRQRITQFTPKGWNAWHVGGKIELSGPGDRTNVHTATHDVRIRP